MSVSNEQNAALQEALELAIGRYYSHRPEDIEEAKQLVESAIASGKVRAQDHPRDIVNILLLGTRDHEYLTVRSLALELLRDPARFGTTSNGEGLAGALMFSRED